MAIELVIGESLYYLSIIPARIIIQTSDSLATVMEEGYLDEETSITYSDNLRALVLTTDGLYDLDVSMANDHISLVAPKTIP